MNLLEFIGLKISICYVFLLQGCGIRTFEIGGIMDASTQHTGTPYSTGYLSNKVFVNKPARSVSTLGPLTAHWDLLQYTGTPYSAGYLSNKVFISKLARSVSTP